MSNMHNTLPVLVLASKWVAIAIHGLCSVSTDSTATGGLHFACTDCEVVKVPTKNDALRLTVKGTELTLE